jgi:DNA topoisomerase-1
MNILIVESKAKSKTIQRYLGRAEWRVLSTGGHVQALPSDRSKHDRKEVRKAYWSSRGAALPDPPWVWSERGEAALRAICDEAAKHTQVTFYLASDPDREGERIAWHLERLLRDLGPCLRVTFQEVTKDALLRAIANPRPIDGARVDAALVRVFVDRLVGWRASKQARSGVGRGGMGRVQTPVLGFIVERELEREAHDPIPYFEVRATTDDLVPGLRWRVRFHEPEDPDAWRGDDDKVVAHRTHQRSLAEAAHGRIAEAGALTLTEVQPGEAREKPPAPFRTDTLLRAASSRFGWSPKRTAKLASDLYETGLITYIRTDSTRLSEDAISGARQVIEARWGSDALGAGPTTSPQGQAVQDAHEAIRPTDLALSAARLPDGVQTDARQLYTLIRGQTFAAFMKPALRHILALRAGVEGLICALETRVRWYHEPGWRRALEPLDGAVDTTPVSLMPGVRLALAPAADDTPNPALVADRTRPPARYTAAAIIKLMRETGIGRPSTYASTIDKLLDHQFIQQSEGLEPTEAGRHIWLEVAPRYAADTRPGWFSVETTASLEASLDQIEQGSVAGGATWIRLRDGFVEAHEGAQAAAKAGTLSPQTRKTLEDFIAATPTLAGRIGDLDSMNEARGRALRDQLKKEDHPLPPTEAQQRRVERLLELAGCDLQQASIDAGLAVAEPATRPQHSAIIDHLKAQVDNDRPMSSRQERLVQRLVAKADMDETEACALVGASSYADLTGGRDGTASALIDRLKQPR